jgi:acyl carrier protein
MAMTDAQQLDATIRLALGLADDAELAGAAYGRTDGWDSVGHMELVVGIEAAFGIAIDAEDVLAMSDYAAIRRILQDRYAIEMRGR